VIRSRPQYADDKDSGQARLFGLVRMEAIALHSLGVVVA
jgi:hypothetical protein